MPSALEPRAEGPSLLGGPAAAAEPPLRAKPPTGAVVLHQLPPPQQQQQQRQSPPAPAISHQQQPPPISTTTSTTTTPSPPSPAPKCPALPLELWMHILSLVRSTEDLPHLWFAARATSRALRAAAERVFPTTHLRDWLHVCTFHIPRSRLAFERLNPADGAKAVLRARPWRGFEESPVDVRRRGSVLGLEEQAGDGAGAGVWGEYLRRRG
ncbi:hypothetical protein B0J12DRAFT_207612 [Macrophomina phaseolina]|uniref:F-box domain-containing protein n=1 Tax=Macrophomina phaseolina TaxID=35725 RepID=A0ABQ8G515_9PEZI|nr:hypothetical protein B0J12DRAFT_207612 [Macrophomina phaseolina]